MTERTPADKSAEQRHLLHSSGETLCGIKFRRVRFFQRNVTGFNDVCSCPKCETRHRYLGRRQIFKKKPEQVQ